jgi:hypothetical protein
MIKKAVGHLMSMFWRRAGSPGFGCGKEPRMHPASLRLDELPALNSMSIRRYSIGAVMPTLLSSRLDLDLVRNIVPACRLHRRRPLRPLAPGA